MTLTLIGYGYFGSMCFDAREVWSHRARESRERRDERIARKSTLSVRKPVYRRHVIERERETDSGKSDPFFQCPNVVFIVLKHFIVAIRFVVLVGSARASSLATTIRVPLCAAHVALVMEKMSLERKMVGSAAMDGARRHVGYDNDNDNDTLREVPHPSNEGLAIQARVSGPWLHKKESVLLVELARRQGAQVQTVKRQNVVQRYLK